MRNQQVGLTLTEAVVLALLLAAIVAILLPALPDRHSVSPRSNCQSNLHQLASGAILYTQDYNGRLPCAWRADHPGARSGGAGWIAYEQPPDPVRPTRFAPQEGALWPYFRDVQPHPERVYQCPEDRYARRSGNSYAINGYLSRDASPAVTAGGAALRIGLKLARFRNPAATFLFTEEGPSTPGRPDTTDDGFFLPDTAGSPNPTPDEPTRRHALGFNAVYCDGHADYLKHIPESLRELRASPLQ